MVDVQEVYEQDIRPHFTAGVAPVSNATGVLLHGQPGIGKTTRRSVIVAELAARGGAIVANGDLLRPYDPRSVVLRGNEKDMPELDKAVDTNARQWRSKLIDHARGRDEDAPGEIRNIVVDSNLAGAASVDKLVDQLGQTHDLEVQSVAGPIAVSRLRALDRWLREFEATGSAPYCPSGIQDGNYDGCLESAGAVDSNEAIRRAKVFSWYDGSLIHEQDRDAGTWPPGGGFRAAVERARSEPFTSDQQAWFLQTAESLAIRLNDNHLLDELHRACDDARLLSPSQGPARDRLEGLIATLDPTRPAQERRASIALLKVAHTNNAKLPGSSPSHQAQATSAVPTRREPTAREHSL